MFDPGHITIKLRNLADDAIYAIGDRLIFYMHCIGDALVPLVRSVVPTSGSVVALVPKRWDACEIADRLRDRTGWHRIDLCTERTEDHTIIANLDETKRELLRLNPSAVLFIDFVVAGGGTAEKVVKELRNVLPNIWLGFVCVIASDEINRVEKYVDWYFRIKQSEVDRSVKPPRLKAWALLSDIGDRIRETLLETPIEWERKLVAERLNSHLNNNFLSCSNLDEVRAVQFTATFSLIGAPVCFTNLAAIRYGYKKALLDHDTWLSVIRLGQARGVPYPIDGNWEVRRYEKATEHLYQRDVARAIEEMKKFGFVHEVEPFKYKPDVRFRMAYEQIVWPVVKEYSWSKALHEYAYDSISQKEELKQKASILIKKGRGES